MPAAIACEAVCPPKPPTPPNDRGTGRNIAAMRYAAEMLAYYYAAQGRPDPAGEAVRALITNRYDIIDKPGFSLYVPKG